jgi:1-deoxy-D-xylulose-5-phosphate reductoisomerase
MLRRDACLHNERAGDEVVGAKPMRKRLAILGSTGSVGVNTLDIVHQHPERFRVVGLAAGSNIDLLEQQMRRFHPSCVSVFDLQRAKELRERTSDLGIEVFEGNNGACAIAGLAEVDLVLSAIVGGAGLAPTLSAIRAGSDVAIANKEPLVMAGELVMREAQGRVRILPVDSEHNAIFQALAGHSHGDVRRLLLTASGGPFRTLAWEKFGEITVHEALQHPNWRMGRKITVDSATMMNKGLEVIEARWLFGVSADQVEVVVHPQSIVHSMVEYVDGSVIAQLGIPDMRIPIAYALNYPERLANTLPRLDLARIGTLTFEPPDLERFPCLRLGFEAIHACGTLPAVLNAANETTVEAFLHERIRFMDIPAVIEETLQRHEAQSLIDGDIEVILEADRWARETATAIISCRSR